MPGHMPSEALGRAHAGDKFFLGDYAVAVQVERGENAPQLKLACSRHFLSTLPETKCPIRVRE